MFVAGRQHACDFVTTVLHNPVQRQRRILPTAPTKDDFFFFQ
jgi:hypothetical protein